MTRLAKSLALLRDEVNRAAPKRSKSSDGWISDAAHRARPSRHNPNNAGVVCALDITHDPAGGMDVHALARRLVKTPHPDLEYVISNGQTASRGNGWRWVRYGGSNPHTKHAHFAVGRGPDSEPRPPYDTTAPWGVTPTTPPPAPQEDDDMPPPTLALLLERPGDRTRWHCYRLDGNVASWCPTPEAIDAARYLGAVWWGGSQDRAHLDPVIWSSLAILTGPLANLALTDKG